MVIPGSPMARDDAGLWQTRADGCTSLGGCTSLKGKRMSDIKLVRTHRLTVAQARAVAQRSADDLAREYDLVSEWHGDTLHFHRSGVEGHMRVTDREIALDVKLGFLLRAFKGKFEQNIGKHLDELLAEPVAPVAEASPLAKAGAPRAPGKLPPAKGEPKRAAKASAGKA